MKETYDKIYKETDFIIELLAFFLKESTEALENLTNQIKSIDRSGLISDEDFGKNLR